jgi:hypothetical protein
VRRGGQLEWHRASSFAFVADDIIETPAPQPIHVAEVVSEGLVEAKSGGFKFPDGTVQATANEYNIAQLGIHIPTSVSIPVNQRLRWPDGVTAVKVDPLNQVDTVLRRITPKRAGYYKCYARTTAGQAGVTFVEAIIFKNGVNVSSGLHNYPTDAGYLQSQTTELIQMNGTTDYLECGIRVNVTAGTGNVDLQDGSGSLLVEFASP